MKIQTTKVPTLDEVQVLLREKLPQYEVKQGWGLVKWVLVKQSWLIGIHVSVNEKKKTITVMKFIGSRWAILLQGLLFLFINIFAAKTIYNATCDVLNLAYGEKSSANPVK